MSNKQQAALVEQDDVGCSAQSRKHGQPADTLGKCPGCEKQLDAEDVAADVAAAYETGLCVTCLNRYLDTIYAEARDYAEYLDEKYSRRGANRREPARATSTSPRTGVPRIATVTRSR